MVQNAPMGTIRKLDLKLRQLFGKLKRNLSSSIAAARRRKMRLFWVVCLVIALGLISTAAMTMILNRLLGEGFLSWPTAAALTSERLDVVKVALLVAGGIGGAVALTVSYRKQKWAEEDLAGKRSAYAAAATQLGDLSPTVRLAGVYALANLADDWPEQRQQCVDVLCGHLRVPWTAPLQDNDAPTEEKPPHTPKHNWGEEQVRTTILTVIADHLRHPTQYLPRGVHSWSTLHLNLTGAEIPGWDLAGCQFSGRLSAKDLRLLPHRTVNLFMADLGGANLTGADLGRANLFGANLSMADLGGADLGGANLFGANLFGTNLFETNLGRANLGKANLGKANLIGANLIEADLTEANLNGTIRPERDLPTT